MGSIFNQDFRDFINALNESQTKYVLVGGYSVMYHGFPRTTGDLDIFVEVSEENYQKLATTFYSFGLALFDMTRENFLHNNDYYVFSFGTPPVSIEILKSISGVTFQEVYEKSLQTKFDGLDIRIIHLNHLKQNKLASGRNKDLNDLENL